MNFMSVISILYLQIKFPETFKINKTDSKPTHFKNKMKELTTLMKYYKF